jgi:prepilin-type N-terminal cleavage/methylation domain-containing protein
MKDVFTKKSGFTLAEILVTLLIIGIIAVLVLPPLIVNAQNAEYTSALKKAYNMTNQALYNLTLDNGLAGDLASTGLFASTYSGNEHTLLGEAITKYIKTSKNCKTTTNQGCFASETNQYYDGSYTGTNQTYDAWGAYKFIISDGMSFLIYNYKNDCNTPTYSTGRTGNMAQTCGYIVIDVNGPKSPNSLGRDTFIFFITNRKGAILYPQGGADLAGAPGWPIGDYWWRNPADGKTPRLCTKTSKDGGYCTGRIMEEGWQMNY